MSFDERGEGDERHELEVTVSYNAATGQNGRKRRQGMKDLRSRSGAE